MQEGKVTVWGGLTKNRKEEKQKARRNTQLNAEFQKREKGDKKAFFNEKCKKVEENNRMGKGQENWRDQENIICKDEQNKGQKQ